ncbi:hypothetical protein [Burkholderia phage BCSR129]|nr:hypothetical protein [Burkholderia phage BCSR129]
MSTIKQELDALKRREQNLMDAPAGTPEQEAKIAEQLDVIGKKRASLLAQQEQANGKH